MGSSYGDFLYTTGIPIIAGFVVVLNLFEIGWMLRKRRKLTPSLTYLLNLSISDVFVGVIMIVLKSMDPFMKTTLKGNQIAKEVYSILKHVFVRFSIFVSIFGLIALTFDRLFAITAPFRHRKRGKSFPYKVCVGVWFVSTCCVSLVYCISRFHLSDVDRYNNLVFPISVSIALVFFVVCYVAIFITIRRSQQSSNGSNTTKKDEFKKQVRFVMLAVKTVISFAVCWIPFSTCNLLKVSSKSCGGKDVERLFFTIAFFNSVLNPFVYFTHKKRSPIGYMKKKFFQDSNADLEQSSRMTGINRTSLK